MKKIKKLAISTLVTILTLTVCVTNISADNTDIHFNEDKTVAVTVSKTTKNEESIINIEVETIDENVEVENIKFDEEYLKKESTYNYSHIVGENGNYKFTVEVSRLVLIKDSNEKIERKESFDFIVTVDDIVNELEEQINETPQNDEKTEIAQKDENKEQTIPYFIPKTNEVVELTETEIEQRISNGTMSVASPRAMGMLNIPNGFQGRFRIDSYSGGWQNTSYSWGVAYIDGNVAYCIDPTRQASHGNAHTSDNFYNSLSEPKQDMIWKIAYYGYGYEGDNNFHRYLAAQEMIWELMTIGEVRGYGGNETFSISWTGTDGENISTINNYKTQINGLLGTYSKRPSFHNTTQDVKLGEVITLTDTNGVLSRYTAVVGNGVTLVSKNGNTLQLRVDSNNFDSQVRFVKAHSPSATSTVSWGHGDSQKVFTHGQDRFDPNSSIVRLNLQTTYITAKKVDENGNALANSTIRMSYSNSVDSNGFLNSNYTDYTTNAQGFTNKTEWSNSGQTVYLQEIKAPSGFVIDKTIKTVVLQAGNENTVTFTNKRAMGRISLVKKSTDGTVLPNIVFDVKNAQNVVVDTITTNTQGVALSKTLPLGNYTLTEKSVTTGIVLDTKPINVSLVYQNQNTPVVTVSVNATNKYQRGNITLTKVENNWDSLFPQNKQKALQGATIALYAKNEIKEGSTVIYTANQLIGNAVTNAQGKVTFTNLPIGNYYANETVAPIGYVLFQGTWDITIGYSGQNTTTEITEVGQTVTNQIMYAKSKLHKSGKGGSVLLENATFGLFTNAGQKIGEWKTDASGEITTPNLRYGTYYWQEVVAPTGYWLDDTKHFFTVNEKTHDTTIDVAVANTFIEAKILVKKIDSEDGKPLENVSFGILDESMNRVSIKFQQGTGVVEKDTWYTDSNGEFLLEANLPYGKYYLVELQALEGYLPIAPVPFTVDENQDYINLQVIGTVLDLGTIQNDRIKGDIEILKIDIETKLPVKAEFDILSVDGTLMANGVTDSNGKLLIEDLDYGTYIVVEKWVEEPYIINPNNISQFVTITEHQKVYEVTFENEAQEIKVFKEDMEGNPIPNTEFELHKVLTDGTRELITTVVTDNTGVAKLPFLLDGKYVVIETKVDEPYVINPNNKEQELVITSTEAKYNVTFKNEKATGRIERVKYDSKNNNVIEGVKYGLYDVTEIKEYTYDSLVNLSPLYEAITDPNGKIVIVGLDISKTYVLIEISAPFGYEISKELELVKFEYIDNETPVITNVGDLFNDRTKVLIHGEKRDIATNELITTDDFVLELTDKDGSVVEPKEFKDGVFTWEVDSLEMYYLREVKAPQGYQLSDEIIEIDTSKEVDGNLYVIEYFNTSLPSILIQTGIEPQSMSMAYTLLGIGFALVLISKRKRKENQI